MLDTDNTARRWATVAADVVKSLLGAHVPTEALDIDHPDPAQQFASRDPAAGAVLVPEVRVNGERHWLVQLRQPDADSWGPVIDLRDGPVLVQPGVMLRAATPEVDAVIDLRASVLG